MLCTAHLQCKLCTITSFIASKQVPEGLQGPYHSGAKLLQGLQLVVSQNSTSFIANAVLRVHIGSHEQACVLGHSDVFLFGVEHNCFQIRCPPHCISLVSPVAGFVDRACACSTSWKFCPLLHVSTVCVVLQLSIVFNER